MGWFALFQILGLVALIILVALYCHFRKIKFWSFIWRNIRWTLIVIASVALIITIVCWKPLYQTAHCYFRGVSMHADTKYSWFLGECQIRTPSGSYVPLTRSRGMPEGTDNHQEGDATDIYGY